MYSPFLTSEVKCGGVELDVADRQKAYSQSIIMRGLHALSQLAGREKHYTGRLMAFQSLITTKL